MSKILIVDYEKCTGCRLCEMVCSVVKEGASDPAVARIHVIKWEREGFYIPMFCQQCEEPFCAAVCPVNAIRRDDTSGRMVQNEELCVGCKSCISACLLGGVGFNDKNQKIIRCDLCDGDPVCVKYCETKAIQYVDSDTVQIRKQRVAAEKLRIALKV